MKPWKRIEPTTSTKVGWRTIVTKTFVMSDGKRATFDTFGNEGQEFVAVIGLTPDDEVVVARQFRFGPERIMDELPGGFVDGDESPETAARREFLEETGYSAGTMTYLGAYNKDTYMNATWHVFFATECVATGEQELEVEEHIEIRRISVPELIANAKNNKMTDAVGVFMAYDELMKHAPEINKDNRKEYTAELLKERIYATFALIAVLATIDAAHVSALHAAAIITGTIISLWAASIVAAIMSRRMVYRGELNHEKEIRHQVRLHAPMLFALVFPLILIGATGAHAISLTWAINISIVSALLLLVGWSVNSAKSLHSKKIPTAILILLQLAIGFGIIALKIAVGH